jgi:hypothetical protein
VSGSPLNNGVEVQGLTILCVAAGRTLPALFWLAKGLPNAMWTGPENGPTVLTVSDDTTGQTLATKQFRRRSEATEVRSVLVAAIEQMDSREFTSTDWQALTDAV